MAEVIITLKDTPMGGVSIHTEYKPAVGSRCSLAQAAALDIIRRTAHEYGLPQSPASQAAPGAAQ